MLPKIKERLTATAAWTITCGKMDPPILVFLMVVSKKFWTTKQLLDDTQKKKGSQKTAPKCIRRSRWMGKVCVVFIFGPRWKWEHIFGL